MVIALNGREFQREAGMIILEKLRISDYDPTIRNRTIIRTQLNNNASRTANPLQEGEFVIMKDDPIERERLVLRGDKEDTGRQDGSQLLYDYNAGIICLPP
jgi:hypothetical protein